MLDPRSLVFDGPPSDALTMEPERPPHRDEELPDVSKRISEVTENPSAKLTDQLGQALRAGLGVGALAILPELVEDLRRTRDPDARLKFLALAFKEGGYGTKEDKTANLPVFHFNFVGSSGSVTVEQVPQVAAESEDGIVEDARYTEVVHPPTPLALEKVAAINADFDPPPSAEAGFQSIFDLIGEPS